jgi:CheY-like chemotaxis protein
MSNDRSTSLRQVKILLVEDHIDTLNAFAKFLRSLGHFVFTADGYQAAIDLAKNEQFDLAVCDIALWDGNGCELLKNLRKIRDFKAIAVTAFTLSDEIEDYHAAGFSAVFQKPFNPSQISSAISQLTLSRH